MSSDTPNLDGLMTMAEAAAKRAGKPIEKPKTRLQETIAERALVKVDEKAFKAEVWKRDKDRCRCCGRKVQKILGRVPERGEVHHIHGRVGDLRFEARSALLLCLTCHERVTGRVNEHRLIIHPTKTFQIRQGRFIDARAPVTFQETRL